MKTFIFVKTIKISGEDEAMAREKMQEWFDVGEGLDVILNEDEWKCIQDFETPKSIVG